jgi:hypothetical protein
MRRWVVAAGAACAVLLTHSAGAQNGAQTTQTGTTMPGTVVGSYSGTVGTVGKRLPDAAPAAGLPITSSPYMRPYDPARPYDMFKGTNIDPKQVLAPLVGPDGKPVEPPDALDKLSAKLKALFTFNKAAPPRPPYAPGISRRNRERAEQRMWRRD